MFQEKADETGRNGGYDEQPAQTLVRRLDLAPLERPKQPPDDAHPLVAVEEGECQGSGHMQSDKEGEEERLLGRLRRDDVSPAK